MARQAFELHRQVEQPLHVLIVAIFGSQLADLDLRPQLLRRNRGRGRRTCRQSPAKPAQRTDDLLPPRPACVNHHLYVFGVEMDVRLGRSEHRDKQ